MVFASLASSLITAYWFYADYEAIDEEARELDLYEVSALELLESVKVSNERLLDQGICRFVTDCTDSQRPYSARASNGSEGPT